jgi:hypothetical protein
MGVEFKQVVFISFSLSENAKRYTAGGPASLVVFGESV